MFDASVLVDALVVAGPAGDDAREVLRDRSVLHVPSIFAAEATSAIRSMQARGDVRPGLARGAVSKIKVVQTVQYPFEPFSTACGSCATTSPCTAAGMSPLRSRLIPAW